MLHALAPPDVVKEKGIFTFLFQKIIITPFGKKKKRAVMSDMTGRKDNHHLDFSMCQVVVASLSKYTDNGTTHIHNVCVCVGQEGVSHLASSSCARLCGVLVGGNNKKS
jgi:hypothetical protein